MPNAPRYIDPLSDFGFKHLFGREESKPALVHFLNSLLPPERQIAGVDFIPTEMTGSLPIDRTVFVDLHCRAIDGTTFILEIQRRHQDHFRDRSLLYVARTLSRDALRGDWDYRFEPIVLVALLEFESKEESDNPHYLTEARLFTTEGVLFSDTVTIIHVELPKFGKSLEELTSPLDHWLYLNKHLSTMEKIPAQFSGRVFTDWITDAEYAQLTPTDQRNYDRYWMARNDRQNQDAYAKRVATAEGLKQGLEQGLEQGLKQGLEQGLERGREQGLERGHVEERMNLIRTFARNGMSPQQIAELPSFSVEEVEEVLKP